MQLLIKLYNLFFVKKTQTLEDDTSFIIRLGDALNASTHIGVCDHDWIDDVREMRRLSNMDGKYDRNCNISIIFQSTDTTERTSIVVNPNEQIHIRNGIAKVTNQTDGCLVYMDFKLLKSLKKSCATHQLTDVNSYNFW